MNQQALEAAKMAAKVEWAFRCSEAKARGFVDGISFFSDSVFRAAITAYAEAMGERVVFTNKTSNDMAICRMNRNGEAFGPVTLIKHGYEIIERKAGT